MLFPVDHEGPRDMEDALRSLGAVLDSIHARSILVREVDEGLIVRAQISETLGDRLDGRWTALERRITREDLSRYRQEAVHRRGSGHVAGPHERSLRMIGRHIDEHALVATTLIQHPAEGGWLLWHGTDPTDGPSLVLLNDEQLLVLDAREAAAREARERPHLRRGRQRHTPDLVASL